MAVKYNPIEDNFTTFEAVETPKVANKSLLRDLFPLMDNYNFIPQGIYVSDKGEVKAEDNLKRMIRDTPEIEEIQESKIPSYTGTKNLKDDQKSNAVYIMNYLINNGQLQPHQAAGIVGSLVRESGLNTGAYNSNDVGLPGGGLAGFRGENFSKLKAYAKNKGKSWKDIDTQLDYILSTIGNTVKDKLSKATNPHEASEAWASYEKYAGYDGKLSSAKSWQKQNGWSDEKTMQWINNEHKKRSDYANEIYELWKTQA